MVAGDALGDLLGVMKGMIDTGAWGLAFNVTVFTAISALTRED
tara:strand:- start:67 stop:195 length:129 start_codon:yes stop_codon:yes gene_type:complete